VWAWACPTNSEPAAAVAPHGSGRGTPTSGVNRALYRAGATGFLLLFYVYRRFLAQTVHVDVVRGAPTARYEASQTDLLSAATCFMAAGPVPAQARSRRPAFMLADYARTDSHRLRRVEPVAQAALELAALVRARTSLVGGPGGALALCRRGVSEADVPGATGVLDRLPDAPVGETPLREHRSASEWVSDAHRLTSNFRHASNVRLTLGWEGVLHDDRSDEFRLLVKFAHRTFARRHRRPASRARRSLDPGPRSDIARANRVVAQWSSLVLCLS